MATTIAQRALRDLERVGEFGPAVERVGALAGLDLDMLGKEIDPLGRGEALDRVALCVDPETACGLAAPSTREDRKPPEPWVFALNQIILRTYDIMGQGSEARAERE